MVDFMQNKTKTSDNTDYVNEDNHGNEGGK